MLIECVFVSVLHVGLLQVVAHARTDKGMHALTHTDGISLFDQYHTNVFLCLFKVNEDLKKGTSFAHKTSHPYGTPQKK